MHTSLGAYLAQVTARHATSRPPEAARHASDTELARNDQRLIITPVHSATDASALE